MVASMTAVRGTPSAPGPSGVACVSTTLPAPSPSTIRITTARGPGQLNSAVTGTPDPAGDHGRPPPRRSGPVPAWEWRAPGGWRRRTGAARRNRARGPAGWPARRRARSAPIIVATSTTLSATGGRGGYDGQRRLSRGDCSSTCSRHRHLVEPDPHEHPVVVGGQGPPAGSSAGFEGPARASGTPTGRPPHGDRHSGAPRCGQAPGPTCAEDPSAPRHATSS